VLVTKLFAPTPRPKLVARPGLMAQLDTALDSNHRLTLVVSAVTTISGPEVTVPQ
jgi:ATP/maltotriose-dependent transcriptional regulator MalT